MKFEIYDRHGVGLLEAYQLSCVPFAQLDDMAKNAGYKFKVDGKSVSANKVKEAVAASLGISASDVNTTKAVTTSSTAAEPIYSKQVRCKDTGAVYKNQSEAAKALGIDPAQVSDSIKTGRPRSGYTFEKVLMSEVA